MRPLLALCLTLLLAGCGGSSNEFQSFQSNSTQRAQVRDLSLRLNPTGRAPLAAQMLLTTDQPTVALKTEVEGGLTLDLPVAPATVGHAIPILGFLPGRRHTVRVLLEDTQGNRFYTEPQVVETAELPADFPRLRVTTNLIAQREPGFLMVTARGFVGTDLSQDYLIILDREGQVVWYLSDPGTLGDVDQLPSGELLAVISGQIWRLDMLGNTSQRFSASGLRPAASDTVAVSTDSFHHEVGLLPNGNYFALSTEARIFADYPLELPPGTSRGLARVIGDTIVEFKADGTVVNRLSLLDVCDPFRLSYNSLTTFFWGPLYGPDSFDWTHGNAAFFTPDNGVLVSLRHQDAIVKLDRSSGAIRWILGDPAGWNSPYRELVLNPTGVFEYPYHSHGVKLTPQGTVLLFDNGNHRALPPAPSLNPNSYSRAVEYRINEQSGSFEQVWSFGDPVQQRFFSGFFCDADYLPQTGNILITDGGRAQLNGQDQPTARVPGVNRFGRILEVTHDQPATVLFELFIEADQPSGYNVYRSEVLPSLFGDG